jgi:hypothetical protein
MSVPFPEYRFRVVTDPNQCSEASRESQPEMTLKKMSEVCVSRPRHPNWNFPRYICFAPAPAFVPGRRYGRYFNDLDSLEVSLVEQSFAVIPADLIFRSLHDGVDQGRARCLSIHGCRF